MAAGKSFKWHGSLISVMTGFAGGSPLIDITGITNANPAVVTAVGHGRVDGAVVKVSEVVGMVEVNDGVYVVNVLTADTLELIGENSTGFGAYTSGGKINPGVFSQMCELTGYSRSGGSTPEIDNVDICSTAAESIGGLPDFGTTQLSFKFAPSTAIQVALHGWHASGDIMAVRVVLPNSGGNMVQKGWMQQESESASNGGKWEATATIRNTGARYDYT